MKQTVRFIGLFFLTLCLAACQSKAVDPIEDIASYDVEIIKQLDHASLNEIADAIVSQLDAIAAEKGIVINVNVDSGQNDPSVLKQIADQAIANDVDAIIPIATLAAQVTTASAANTKTPVIFAAISNPEDADLDGIDYVTGTSDGLNTPFIFDMMFLADPDIAKVGLLYSLSEKNSERPIAEAKQILDSKGIGYVEAVGNNNDEIITAASVLVSEGVEAIFTPTDNVVMAAELAVAKILNENGIAHYAGADSFVSSGAFATCGVNYTQLGYKTADICYEILISGFDNIEGYHLMENDIITVNTETAELLGIDPAIFAQMGANVVQITTSGE